MIIFSKIILTTALFLAFSVGAGTEREDAAVNAPTGNAAPEVVTEGDRVAQSANLTATAAVAEARTGTGIGKRRETESGHQKTKVPSDYFCLLLPHHPLSFQKIYIEYHPSVYLCSSTYLVQG